MSTEFVKQLNPHPATDEVREAVLANPGFGQHFTDHMVCIDWQGDVQENVGRWDNARLQPYGPLSLDPSTAVLHYGQEIFEGLKAYRHADGSVWTFRPEANAARLNRSAQRLALPTLPEEVFVDAIRELVVQDQQWVPSGEGESLYLRPFMIGTEPFLGVRPSRQALFSVIASPAGNYFGSVEPVDIWLSRTYARAGTGGTGAAKCGGNYAASLVAQMEGDAHGCSQVVFLDPERDDAIEELGGMNVFFVFDDNRLVTPELTGTILEGITRDSVIQLARERGMTVEERAFTLDEWREGVRSGHLTEVFACGTAAVIAPVRRLVGNDETIGPDDAQPGEVTMSIRQQLLDIQTGRAEDTHGWLTRLV
ncbi:branched-chain amino acid aminotransferase [Glutamicibacter protophormiae]|uniref:Branched-chain-amino-acid aminotransferase n=1 Tax=Kocuria varians TaxID=1272 RepID=A0A7D7L2S1_KOCVA|nr:MULTISPECIES: branched-chain amino acid aminotransferase [Kocuria]WNB89468.1 branched-chain amino acid aminotransferase [Glutamicibacter protophormiae]MDN5630403.1 branched-chain amino acid aminotransferase [Kocuria sp.]QMS57408.1 Branched-chain-amino-acid aminotransferase [Kocuria varians]RUP84227.1 branched-chain amino acid aminotransferase [Kocuria sp. HSID17590]RUQ09695.1 branched-chain amino acid aminotransferase [Kocuria sp. HSID17582]